MEQVVSATEARTQFGEMMRRAVEEETLIIVERAGQPQIVMLSIAAYERLRTAQESPLTWQEQVAQTRDLIAQELGERELPDPARVIRQMREERDVDILDLR